MLDSAELTPTEREMLLENSKRNYFKSDLEFLKSHNGLRPGCIHTIMGVAGGGKSTLIRTLIFDILKDLTKDQKILLWLSEESRMDFLTEFHHLNVENNPKLSQLLVSSEIDLPIDKPEEALNWFKEVSQDAAVVIMDNITTSVMYMDRGHTEQSNVGKEIKTIAKEANVPIIVVAHSGAETSENMRRLLNMNDIRGNKSIVNLSNFFYILQSFHIEEHIYPTIRITKHRGQNCEHQLYYLQYSKETRSYTYDKKLEFKEFKEAFKERDVL